MIISFKNKNTEDIWNGIIVRRLPVDIQKTARRKLRMINNAHSVVDLRCPPANNLEMLKGDRVGYYSIRINRQWRICFKWQDSNAYEVEIVDYH